MSGKENLANLADQAVAGAIGTGDVFVIIEHDSRCDVRWARNTLTTNGVRSSVTATVIAFAPVAGGVGTATASLTGPTSESLAAAVDSASAAAASSPPAEDAFDLVRDLHSGSWDLEPVDVDIASLHAISAGLGEVFNAGKAADIEHFGYAEQSVVTTWLASTTGVRRTFIAPAGRVEMNAKSHGRTRSAWQGAASEDIRTTDISAMDRALRQGLAWQATRIDVAPGRHRAILSAGAAADLMCEFWWSATARDASEGRSVFSRPGGGTRIGEPLTSRAISIISDPRDGAFASQDFLAVGSSGSHASVFDNGMDVTPARWLTAGTLTQLIAPRATARSLEMPAVASADCLRIEDAEGSGNLADVISRVDDALLVTCVWYNRVVDPQSLLLTGLTRDGVYVVRNGEIVGCSGNFRFNDSPVGLLSRVSDSGASARTLPREMGDYVHRIAAPALVVEDFNFSTASDAL